MEEKTQAKRYCIICGEENKADRKTCAVCGEELYPEENLLEDYLRREAGEQLKDKAAETVFDRLKKFLLAHLYGIVLTVSVIFTAASAAAALGTSNVPRDAVRISQPPAANALGYLADEAAEEPEPTPAPELTPVPEPAAPPESTSAPEPTPEPEPTQAAASAREIYEAYRELLPDAAGLFPGYYIYDIDKDGVPELLLTAEDGPNQGLEVYSFGEEGAYSAGILWGFSNGIPIPASYPEGNGVVLTEIARDYECIWVIAMEDGVMTGDVRTSENSVYEEPLYDVVSVYYQNAEEGIGVSVGHPYREDTAEPFFEGSQLLGFNSVSDDAALREALGF